MNSHISEICPITSMIIHYFHFLFLLILCSRRSESVMPECTVEIKGQFVRIRSCLPLREICEWKQGYSAWHQVPLPAELSCQLGQPGSTALPRCNSDTVKLSSVYYYCKLHTDHASHSPNGPFLTLPLPIHPISPFRQLYFNCHDFKYLPKT